MDNLIPGTRSIKSCTPFISIARRATWSADYCAARSGLREGSKENDVKVVRRPSCCALLKVNLASLLTFFATRILLRTILTAPLGSPGISVLREAKSLNPHFIRSPGRSLSQHFPAFFRHVLARSLAPSRLSLALQARPICFFAPPGLESEIGEATSSSSSCLDIATIRRVLRRGN